MPSGKRAKQARRVPPPPVRAGGRREASPRVLAIAGGIVVVIALVVVGAVLLTGGSKKSATASLPTQGSLVGALPDASSVAREFRGIPQSDLTLGSPAAPVTVVVYIDLQCPFCQRFETEAMPGIVADYVGTGKAKVELRPLAFIGADSIRGRDALLAAAEQNKAFDFAQLLYDNQKTENTGWLNDAIVAQAAKSIPGANPRALVTASASSAVAARAKHLDVLAGADKVTGTPTVFVGKSGTHGTQVALKSPTDAQSVVAAIRSASP